MYVMFVVLISNTWADAAEEVQSRYAIVIHGGAGDWPNQSEQDIQKLEQGLTDALTAGRKVLEGGGSSLDAVEQAIRVLEDNPKFNAGKGAVYNAAGKHQLDASIMEGRERKAGAVAAIGVAKHPISVAKLVMTKTKHVLLADRGANRFARRQQAEIVKPEYFWTDETRQQWEAAKQSSSTQQSVHHYGTVGCVALDKSGNLAAGTSTGGLSEKMLGRVGDSPLVAAGTYADNDTCAVSCTGVGELFIRNVIAYDIAARMKYSKQDLESAVAYQIDDLLSEGTGGIIALNQQGQMVLKFNTNAMPRGIANSDGKFEVKIGKE